MLPSSEFTSPTSPSELMILWHEDTATFIMKEDPKNSDRGASIRLTREQLLDMHAGLAWTLRFTG